MSEGEAFWEARYANASAKSSGRPSAALVRFAQDLEPGQGLDLGCSRGDDAVWLAKRGWEVVGVDVAPTVLRFAQRNADAVGVSARVRFEQHDLGVTFPEGEFELVYALYLQSPVPFPRREVLRRAAAAVAPGGLLLIATHGSAAPWSWGDPDRVFPSAQEELDGLGLDPERWEPVFVGPSERTATGPGGQTAQVIDTLVVLKRRVERQSGLMQVEP